jgi:hypothetical protein
MAVRSMVVLHGRDRDLRETNAINGAHGPSVRGRNSRFGQYFTKWLIFG